MHERERGQPVAMSVALREFLQWLYPTRVPTPAEYWPKLMRAIDALDSHSARVPLYDPHTKRSELRRIVSRWAGFRGVPALWTSPCVSSSTSLQAQATARRYPTASGYGASDPVPLTGCS